MSALQSEWARLLVHGLGASGVRDAVISPGARSLPLALAAHGCKDLRCHDVLDERVAGFFAVGMAKAAGRPTLLICTSGSAGANYFAAIVEAAASRTPLVLLTADRPPELHDCGAPQTVDQARYFGAHVRRFFDIGLASSAPEALRSLRRVAAQVVTTSTWPAPGPVHVNVPLRTPLEPPADPREEDHAVLQAVDRLLENPVSVHVPRYRPGEGALSDLAGACRETERGLIVCGAAPISNAQVRAAVWDLGAATRFPLLAEAASQIRFGRPGRPETPRCDAFDLALQDARFAERHVPDLVIQLGAAPLSRSLERYLDRHERCRRWVIASDWQDPTNRASSIVLGEIHRLVGDLAAEVPKRNAGGEWEKAFAAADERAWAAVDADLARDAMSEGKVASLLAASLPPGSLLALSNSLPIRHVDTFVRGDRCDAAVFAQRGANGIDGLISGASGAASAWNAPVALLIGDAAFQHDLGGLAVARGSRVPLVILVLNNRGGRIFEQLPVGQRADLSEVMERHMIVSQAFSVEHAAKTFGVGFARNETATNLDGAIRRALGSSGCTVIEAVVPPHGAIETTRRLVSSIRR